TGRDRPAVRQTALRPSRLHHRPRYLRANGRGDRGRCRSRAGGGRHAVHGGDGGALCSVAPTRRVRRRRRRDRLGEPILARERRELAMDLDLSLDVSGETSQLRLELVYRREVVDRETAIGWLDAVATVLRSGARRPHAVLPGTVWRNRAIDARVD